MCNMYVHVIVHYYHGHTYNTFENVCLFSCIVNHCTEDLHVSAFNTCVFSAVVK